MAVEITNVPSQNAANPLKHAAGLSAVWQKCMSGAHELDGRMLIDREHGQLARLKGSLGMKRATDLVEYTIRNWGKFARKAAEDVGSDIFPEKPSVGWLCKYHATAMLMLHEELQSIAKKQVEQEQAKKDAYAKEMVKTMQQLKSQKPSVTLVRLTPEQFNAYFERDDPANEAFFEQVSQKYGENWRPAKADENGIPCDIEFKKAG